MPVNSRAKGCRGERDAAELLRSMGFAARRGQQFSGDGAPDIITSLAGVHFEIKRSERLSPYRYMEQSARDARDLIPTVMMRSNDEEWLLCLRAVDLVALVERVNAARAVQPTT